MAGSLETGFAPGNDATDAPPGPSNSAIPVAERPSTTPFGAAGIVPYLRRLRPDSGLTASTTDTGPSERGFRKISGRKLESVLKTGGDGYGSDGPSNPNLSSASFQRDSAVLHGGVPSITTSLAVGPESSSRSINSRDPFHELSLRSTRAQSGADLDEGVAIIRPGPARTPTRTQIGVVPTIHATPPQHPRPPSIGDPFASNPRLIRPDAVGRSHPSQDGSRNSRFSEQLP